MNKRIDKRVIFNGIIYIALIVILMGCLFDKQSQNVPFEMFGLLLTGCIVMGLFSINSGKAYVEVSDGIIAFIFFTYGRKEATFFAIIYWVAISIIDSKIYHRKSSKVIFNIYMMTITTYTTATIIIPVMDYLTTNIIVLYTGFIGIYLIVNILILKFKHKIDDGKINKLGNETRNLLLLNFIISTLIAITFGMLWQNKQYITISFVLLNLLILQYCFYIYKKLQFRSEGIKKLLKITEDMVKHGEFSDKCNHLLENLKELIPFNVCALYTFDIDNESVIYPMSYIAPEGIGIGELYFNLSSKGVTVKIVKDGKIYISKNLKNDKNVKAIGKLLEITDTAVFVPVSIEERVVGLISISGGQELEFFLANGVEDILAILANQIALAIENDEIYRNIKNQAEKDHLTNLFNRRALDNEIDELIASETMFSMVMYDIDDFKNVNDTYGHLVGDEVLKSMSDIVRKSIRKTDIACRYGGEEIVIIFKELSKNDAYTISDRIRSNIKSSHVEWFGKDICITVSGGLAAFPEDGKTRDEIIGHADEVLYSQCKSMGKNKVCAYGLELYSQDVIRLVK